MNIGNHDLIYLKWNILVPNSSVILHNLTLNPEDLYTKYYYLNAYTKTAETNLLYIHNVNELIY